MENYSLFTIQFNHSLRFSLNTYLCFLRVIFSLCQIVFLNKCDQISQNVAILAEFLVFRKIYEGSFRVLQNVQPTLANFSVSSENKFPLLQMAKYRKIMQPSGHTVAVSFKKLLLETDRSDTLTHRAHSSSLSSSS